MCSVSWIWILSNWAIFIELTKELSRCHKLKFSKPYICATWWCKHLIYIHTLLVRLSVRFYPINRQNGWTDQAQFFFGTSRDPREGLWLIKIWKNCVISFFIFVKFWKCAKKYYEIRILFNVFFYTVQREDAHK